MKIERSVVTVSAGLSDFSILNFQFSIQPTTATRPARSLARARDVL
jgi:hypothetical protein